MADYLECPTCYYSVAVHPSNINIWYTSILGRRKIPGAQALTLKDFNNVPELFEVDVRECSLKPEQFKDNSHHGIISKIAAKKITRAIDYLVYIAKPKELPNTLHGKGFKFKLNFITLTLSSVQIHSDSDIMNEIFQPFLNTLRQKFKVNNYVWRAEKQANGNIHYHICTDKFIHWNEIRNSWNKHQQKLGYVSRYRDEMHAFHINGINYRLDLLKVWPLVKQEKAYIEGVKHDWDNPNSSDVHSLKHVNNIRAYFIKYMTKSGQSSNIEGRLWGCSVNLSKLVGGQTELCAEIEDEVLKLINSKKAHFYKKDFYSCLFFEASVINKRDFPNLFFLLNTYIKSVFPDISDD
jgi:hypothetical protein